MPKQTFHKLLADGHCWMLENLRLVSPPGSSQPTNLSTFQPFNSSTVLADVYRWIASYSGPGFSIAFADPPYALDACRARGGASGRTLHRGDDGGPEGRGDAWLGACPRPYLRQDASLPLAPPRCGVKKRSPAIAGDLFNI